MGRTYCDRREDLVPPCAKGCPDRTAVCKDSCRKEEYTAWLDLMQKQKADAEFRRNAVRIDNGRKIRMRRANQWRKGNG